MYYRWELADERPTEIVEGANQEKMYPDYSYAAQDGGNIKRKVKIGALAITAILIVGAIAAVPAVLLTLPKFKNSRNTVVVDSKCVQPSTVVSRDGAASTGVINGINVLRHDNLTAGNRSARQVVEQSVNIENYVGRPTNCKDVDHDGDEENETYANPHEVDYEQTPEHHDIQIPADHNVQTSSQKTNGTEPNPISTASTNSNIDEKLSNALKIIANFQMVKSELDSKLIQNDEQLGKESDAQNLGAHAQVQKNITHVNLTDLQQPSVIIVFYYTGEGKRKLNAVDFGDQFLQFINQSETGEWVFDASKLLATADAAMKPLVNLNVSFHGMFNTSATQDLETSTGSLRNSTGMTASNINNSVEDKTIESDSPNMVVPAPVSMDGSTSANMNGSDLASMDELAQTSLDNPVPANMSDSYSANISSSTPTDQRGQADQIIQMLLLNKPFTWILATKDSENHYKHIASGPLNISSVDLVTVSLLSGMDTDNLDTLINKLIEKISVVANQGN